MVAGLGVPIFRVIMVIYLLVLMMYSFIQRFMGIARPVTVAW